MPQRNFPKTISPIGGEGAGKGRGRLTLQGNLVIQKWPLKPKTMEKFKEKHKVIGDK